MKQKFLILTMLISTLSFSQQRRINVSLYAHNLDGTTSLQDGVTTDYHNSYSNWVDMWDALKVPQIAEEISSNRHDTLIAIERRKVIVTTDTTYLNLRHLQQKSYRFKVVCDDMSNCCLSGFLYDNYTNQSYPLNLSGTTTIEWLVNSSPTSSANNRFKIVLNSCTLPVKYVDLQSSKIGLIWTVDEDDDIKQYNIEYSLNGSSFNIVQVTKNKSIIALKDGFYRVVAITQNSNKIYSNIVKWLGNLRVYSGYIYNPSGIYIQIYLYSGQLYYSGNNTQIKIDQVIFKIK